MIAADGEQKAARALKDASETISESSAAMQLRYLQVCSFILCQFQLNLSINIQTFLDISNIYNLKEIRIKFMFICQLDCFQTLYSISSEKNHTIVFPLPIDVIGSLMGGKANEGNPTKTILDIEAEKKSV